MKHRSLIVAAAMLSLLLSGCSTLLSQDYLSVAEHNEMYAYKDAPETTQPETPEEAVVDNYYDLRTALMRFVTEGVEHGKIRLENYSGQITEDVKQAVQYISETDPVGAYAVDYITYTRSRYSGGWLLTVDAVYRRSASEIAAIESVRGNEMAYKKIYEALNSFESSITLRISGYTEEDIFARILSYCIDSPDCIVVIPKVSLAVYPEEGNVRILELHFDYGSTKDELQAMLSEVTSVLSSIYSYMRYGEGELEKANLINSYLAGRFNYVEEEAATVYSLLCKGRADSLSFASVFSFLCKKAGLNCLVVKGMKGENDYAWNMVQIDGIWYQTDIMSAVLSDQREITLRLDWEMYGFSWDKEAYPVCDGTVVEEENSTES